MASAAAVPLMTPERFLDLVDSNSTALQSNIALKISECAADPSRSEQATQLNSMLERVRLEHTAHSYLQMLSSAAFSSLINKLDSRCRTELLSPPLLISAIMLGKQEHATILLREGFSPYLTYEGKNAFYWALEAKFSNEFLLLKESLERPRPWRANFLAQYEKMSLRDSDPPSPALALKMGSPQGMWALMMENGGALIRLQAEAEATGFTQSMLADLHAFSKLSIPMLWDQLHVVWENLRHAVNPAMEIENEVVEAELSPELFQNKKFCQEKLKLVMHYHNKLSDVLHAFGRERMVFPAQGPVKLNAQDIESHLPIYLKNSKLDQKLMNLIIQLDEVQEDSVHISLMLEESNDTYKKLCKKNAMLQESLAVTVSEKSVLQERVSIGRRRLEAAGIDVPRKQDVVFEVVYSSAAEEDACDIVDAPLPDDMVSLGGLAPVNDTVLDDQGGDTQENLKAVLSAYYFAQEIMQEFVEYVRPEKWAELKADLLEISQCLKDNVKELTRARQELHQVEVRSAELLDACASTAARLEVERAQTEALRAEFATLEPALVKLDLQDKVSALILEKEALHVEIDSLKERLRRQLEASERRAQGAAEKIAEQANDIGVLTADLKAARAERDALKVEIVGLKVEKSALISRHAELSVAVRDRETVIGVLDALNVKLQQRQINLEAELIAEKAAGLVAKEKIASAFDPVSGQYAKGFQTAEAIFKGQIDGLVGHIAHLQGKLVGLQHHNAFLFQRSIPDYFGQPTPAFPR